MRKPTITPMKDGPLLCKGLTDLSNSKSNLETKETMALCRCGASETKPYCDGTHGKTGFKDSKLPGATAQKRKDYPRGKITISDNPGVCAHAGFCDGKSPDVFWDFENGERVVKPGKAPKNSTIRTIELCPSGALAYKLKGKLEDNYNFEPRIKIAPNGPYNVQGSVHLEGEQPDSKEHYSLCRCGVSKNKPFCDGSHRKSFNDPDN